MSIYGYSKQVVNEYGLHELSEVTLNVSPSDLRRVAAFLLHCAERIEAGEWRSDHLHLIDHDRGWAADHPKSDIIVAHPAPKPPGVIG